MEVINPKMNDYEDILYLQHHVSKKYPQMSHENRAAQFSPFAALSGHEAAIKETARITQEKIELDETQKVILDEKLYYLKYNPQVIEITYFVKDEYKAGGQYQQIIGKIKKILEYKRMIIMEDGTEFLIDDIKDIIM